MMRPIGYFVHHQGRGHAERCAAIVHALPRVRPVRIFCAKGDIFGSLPGNVTVEVIPSLFEAQGDEAASMADFPTPRTLHCAPLGWPGIRQAMGRLAAWFVEANPVLMICDVSAEIAQLCRICSVPHVKIVQHGNRGDQGHQAAYDGAVGLLAPFSKLLAQPEWGAAFRARVLFAGGLGATGSFLDKSAARQRLGIPQTREVVLVMSGGGGGGFTQAPIAIGARARLDALWITIGTIERDWHATEPSNIEHCGWVENAQDYIAAADYVVASTGNTTCQQILAAGKPFIAVPEWRYFDEQYRKAECLDAAGMAVALGHMPASVEAWERVLLNARTRHDATAQRAAIENAPAQRTALWLETLIERIWAPDVTGTERGTTT